MMENTVWAIAVASAGPSIPIVSTRISDKMRFAMHMSVANTTWNSTTFARSSASRAAG